MCAEEGTCFVTGTAIMTASEAQMETVGSALLHPPCKAGYVRLWELRIFTDTKS